MTDEFSWALLPTWKGRYPWKYVLVTAATMLLIGLVPALVGKSSFSWVGPARWAVFGVAVGVAVAVVVLGRRELVVTAGTFHGYPALDEVTSNQILGIDLVQHWWGRNVHLTVIGGHSTPVPIMSWRIWPDADFEEQMRGLRLALGMPADPPPDIG